MENIKNGISVSKSVDEELNNTENFLVQSAEDAVKYKLVDALQYQDQVDDSLKKN